MAGSGVRGVRILKEVPKTEVLFNDINPSAIKLIKKNLKSNKLKANVGNKDLRLLFAENRCAFDFIDIDPFGSPAKFLESAAFAMKKKSFLAVTATDTGALAGSFPEACMRKYGLTVARTDFYKELGVRALLTSIQRAFAKYDMAFRPALVHSNHFFRVFGFVEKGKQKADKIMEKIFNLTYCQKCLYRNYSLEVNCPECKSKTNIIGPIWSGEIYDWNFVKKVNAELEGRKFKTRFIEEADTVPYYDIHDLCKANSKAAKKMEVIIAALKKKGYRVSRTNFCPTGLKTDAPLTAVRSSL